MKDVKPGDTVHWWIDSDPGDAENGPDPDVHITCGKLICIMPGGALAVDQTETTGEPEVQMVDTKWLASAEEIAEWELERQVQEDPSVPEWLR